MESVSRVMGRRYERDCGRDIGAFCSNPHDCSDNYSSVLVGWQLSSVCDPILNAVLVKALHFPEKVRPDSFRFHGLLSEYRRLDLDFQPVISHAHLERVIFSIYPAIASRFQRYLIEAVIIQIGVGVE